MSPVAMPARPLDPAALLQEALNDVRQRPLAHFGAQIGFLVPLGVWGLCAPVVTMVGAMGMLCVGLAIKVGGAVFDAWMRWHGAFARPWGQLCDLGADAVFELLFLLMAATVLTLFATLRLGLHRDLARHVDGERRMGFAAAFRWPFWRFGTLFVVGVLSPVLVLAAMVPPLGVPIAFHAPTMAIRNVGSIEAAQLQWSALTHDPAKFLLLACLSATLTAVGWAVPVAGPALALAFQHRAARDVLASAGLPAR